MTFQRVLGLLVLRIRVTFQRVLLQEDAIMDLIQEHDILALVIKNLVIYHSVYSKVTKKQAVMVSNCISAVLKFSWTKEFSARLC